MTFYRRRPAVNPKPLGFGDDSESYQQILATTCSRCSIRMTYIEKIKNYKCLTCGFEPMKKEDEYSTDNNSNRPENSKDSSDI